MGPDASFVNQNLKAPAHPVVAVDKRFCHDRPISVLIPQEILQHPNHGAIYEVAKNEFGQHGVGKHNKLNKDPNHGAVHNAAHKVTGHDKHDKYGQNEIRNNEFPQGTTHGAHQPTTGVHGTHGTHGIGHNQEGYDKNQHNAARNAMHDVAHPTGQDQIGQTPVGYDKNQHTDGRNMMHDVAHPSGQNEYGQTQTGYDKNQHNAARNAMHDVAHPTGQDQIGQTPVGYDKNQHTDGRNMMHDAAHGTSGHNDTQHGVHGISGTPAVDQNEFGLDQTRQGNAHLPTHGGSHGIGHELTHGVGQNATTHNKVGDDGLGHNEFGNTENRRGGLGQPTHGVSHGIGSNETRQSGADGGTHGIGEAIAQTVTGHNDVSHNKHGHNDIGHNLTGHNDTGKHEKHGFGKQGFNTTDFGGKNGKGPLLFDLAGMGLNDRDDRVLKDSNGKPIVYLTEKNRIIQRNFVITRDADGNDKIFDVKRKHLSKSPVRADFKDMASGRMCRLGASVLEETHGITALLWLDIGDGKKEKLPVGRLHLPSGSNTDPNVARAADNRHKMTDAVRPVASQHKDFDGQHSKDYQLDIMPGIDASLAVLVAMVTAACTDHKRRSDDVSTTAKQSAAGAAM
ncbi:hypothetical protein Poli38472_010022 [Pythium oligandrum]|uniref:Uncharacterized protein n=1 Tax=Pythium oligandrum TaxID=41045 RepID=A0A8K1C950_PYTOL|nr:hypothetical protein Poli38472_010022 [Pythium oligandrum]|eukprot:TMW58463.1 hypothetical protein Poli38472_010022 [Pythium oligandrum]